MNCPKCETRSLKVAHLRSVEVNRCPACHGIWFDEKELSQLLGLTRQELRPFHTKENAALNAKSGKCPRDDSELLRVYSADNQDVVIDTCVSCSGIWLDGGELTKLQRD